MENTKGNQPRDSRGSAGTPCWHSAESCCDRLMELAAMPIHEQKSFVREWPELGWDGIVVAKAYRDLRDWVLSVDSRHSMPRDLCLVIERQQQNLLGE